MTASDTTQPGTELDQHIVFFDRDRDGRIEGPEIYKALRELGFSRLSSAVIAPALAIGLPSDVDALRKVRHDDSGSFSKDGRFDPEAFEAWFRRTDRNDDGELSRWELLLGSLKLADDPLSAVASIAEFQLVHALLAEDGGLRRQAVEDFLDGDLFREIVARREATEG